MRIGFVSMALFLGLSLQTLAQQWVEQESGVDVDLLEVDMLSPWYGWAVGHLAVLKTTNGGHNWLNVADTTMIGCKSVHFIDSLNGWILGKNLHRTTDGGVTWAKFDAPGGLTAVRIRFKNSSLGWVMATGSGWHPGGNLYKTTDGGETWNYVFNPVVLCSDVVFVDDQHGWLAAGRSYRSDVVGPGYGYIYRTTDGGYSWEFQEEVERGALNNISFYNSDLGVYSGATALTVTTDGGRSWDYIPYDPNAMYHFNQCYGAKFLTPDNLYLCVTGEFLHSGFGGFLVSHDTAKTWEDVEIENYRRVEAIDFINGKHGWAVGIEGRIWALNPPEVSSVDNPQPAQPGFFSLHQNYPNPFRSGTVIEYEVRKSGPVMLAVYDAMGRKVRTLVDGHKDQGNYKYRFEAVDMLPGVYWYTLHGNGFTESKRMVIR